MFYCFSYGVPQGSLIGPILFTVYMLLMANVIQNQGIHFHCDGIDTTRRTNSLNDCVLGPIVIATVVGMVKAKMRAGFYRSALQEETYIIH